MTGTSGQTTTDTVTEVGQLPEGAVPVLALRDNVLFPTTVSPVTISSQAGLAAAQYAARHQIPLLVVLQKDPEQDNATAEELHQVGTLARVVRIIASRDGVQHLVVAGERRGRIAGSVPGFPFLAATIEPLEAQEALGAEIEGRFVQLKQQAIEALRLTPNAPAGLPDAVAGFESPSALADVVASFLDLPVEEKQRLLETTNLIDRLDKVLWSLSYRLEVLRLSHDIGQRTQQTMEGRQREHMLREQLKTIQEELGETDSTKAELSALAEAIAKAGMPDETRIHAERELSRLRAMPEGAGEYSMLRTYLEWLADLPWNKESGAVIDVTEARTVLDQDHFGLEKIKTRILEYLAVRKLNPTSNAPILCFVGPPGVGKTSLGQSIARAMGREFVRVSLGGVHDEAEIRGHRRTYIGALPGNIIQSLRRAASRDSVMMLDEIDKLGQSAQGNPAAALLEVLDPAQNGTFRDSYLGVPFDLSKVVFIATANQLETIPGPLLDRMEVIRLSGYTEREKLEIARKYLVPRQLKENGITEAQADITEDALEAVIHSYTREAGVRTLERQIGALFRNTAVGIAEGKAEHVAIGPNELAPILGASYFEHDKAELIDRVGVATGLAWTPVGGDVLFIEAALVPGSGHLLLTGQLGDVMKESAQAAFTLVRSKFEQLGIDPELFKSRDVHVHVPAGATPKDGPSAGVAMFITQASLFTGRKIRADVAMTGEVSLRGNVMPVGGIKEKVLAAMQAGIKTVMLPARNRRDWDDIPQEAKDALEFVWLETVEQAADTVLREPVVN